MIHVGPHHIHIHNTNRQEGFTMSNRKKNSYGCGGFIFDLFMIVITGGLWLIWIFVREMRNR